MAISIFNRKTKEERFWKWFSKNNITYYSEIENLDIRDQIFDDLTIELKKIHEELVFEFSPIHENGIREFTISADGLEEVFPYVEELVAKAPSFEKWQINSFRQRVPGDGLTIDFGDYKVGYSDIYLRYAKDEDKIGLELNIRDFDDSARTKNAVYVLLDGLIGEYDVVTKISWIDWVSLDESKVDSLHKLVELREIIDHHVNEQ